MSLLIDPIASARDGRSCIFDMSLLMPKHEWPQLTTIRGHTRNIFACVLVNYFGDNPFLFMLMHAQQIFFQIDMATNTKPGSD
jgi:hypothetical protein